MECIRVFTDGSCSNNGRKNAKAGFGVYFGENDPRNVSKRVPSESRQTNNVGEIMALIEVFSILKDELSFKIPIEIYSDSKIAIGWCTTTGEKYARKNKLSYLRFDCRGHGKSDGKFEDFTISDWKNSLIDNIS